MAVPEALAGGIPLTPGWLVVALALYLGAAALGFLVYEPVVRRELAALERSGPADREYLRRRAQAALLGVVTTTMVLAILALMVLKPF